MTSYKLGVVQKTGSVLSTLHLTHKLKMKQLDRLRVTIYKFKENLETVVCSCDEEDRTHKMTVELNPARNRCVKRPKNILKIR